MYLLIEILEAIGDFMETGGPVMWVILLTSLLMWTLIIERYWFLRMTYPRLVQRAIKQWNEHPDTTSWYARRIREQLISRISVALHPHLILLRTLVALGPLLGLLGTVFGMLQVFDTMALTGTGNPRAMASGISLATLTTMAGMVSALSGFYFSARLQHHAGYYTQLARDQLEIHAPKEAVAA